YLRGSSHQDRRASEGHRRAARPVRRPRAAADGALDRIGPAHARGHRGRAQGAARAREEGVIAMLNELVNHVWQSTLVAAAIAGIVALLRDDTAHSRYWLWWAASVKFLVPFSLLTALGAAIREAGAPRIELADWPSTLGILAEPMPDATGWGALRTALLAIWAVGFAAVVGNWIVRAMKVRSLLRASLPFAGSLPRGAERLEARTSAALLEPALVGIVRPVLLLPQGIAEHLSPKQLDAVLEHELSHLRRRDNLTAAVHMVVEAVFWF